MLQVIKQQVIIMLKKVITKKIRKILSKKKMELVLAKLKHKIQEVQKEGKNGYKSDS